MPFLDSSLQELIDAVKGEEAQCWVFFLIFFMLYVLEMYYSQNNLSSPNKSLCFETSKKIPTDG